MAVFLRLDGGEAARTASLEGIAFGGRGGRTVAFRVLHDVRVNGEIPDRMGTSLADGDVVTIDPVSSLWATFQRGSALDLSPIVHRRTPDEWPRITASLAPLLRRTLPDRAARLLEVLDRWHVLSTALPSRPDPGDPVVSCSICATGQPRRGFAMLVHPALEWRRLTLPIPPNTWAILCDVCAHIGAATRHSEVGAALADCRRAIEYSGESGAALERFATRCLPANCSICGAGQASRLYDQNWLAFCGGCFREAAELEWTIDRTSADWTGLAAMLPTARNSEALFLRWRALRRRGPMPDAVAQTLAAHLLERLPESGAVAEELLAREPEGPVGRILGEALPPPGL
jgi:hypothetical protein